MSLRIHTNDPALARALQLGTNPTAIPSATPITTVTSGPSSTRKGVLHIHVVQARAFRRCPGAPVSLKPTASPINAASAGFHISLRVGHPANGSLSGGASAAHALHVPPGGEVVWNTEMELPLMNADHWIILTAAEEIPSASPEPTSTTVSESSRRRSFLASSSHGPKGEARIPVKEYESGVFHDAWITFRRAAFADSSVDYVTGQVHVRFMYQLGSASSGTSPDQSVLSQLSPASGALAHHLLCGQAFWIQVLLQHIDSKGETSGDATAKTKELQAMLHAVLTLLSHAKFQLIMHVFSCLVRRELEFLKLQCGRVDQVWASNLFRRNSVAAKIMAMYCVASGASATTHKGAREGVGKQYLLQLLHPVVEEVIKDVSGGQSNPSSSPSNTNSHASHTAASLSSGTTIQSNHFPAPDTDSKGGTSNPYEIDPAKLGGNHALLERNQTRLVGRSQALLDSVLQSAHASSSSDPSASPGRSAASQPLVPLSVRWLARTLRKCVQDYVASATGTISNNVDSTSPTSSQQLSLINPQQVSHESSHNSVASLFFLRFLCPALVTPVHYGVLSRPPPPAASRALILMAKALQSLVNSAGSVTSAAASRNESSDEPATAGFSSSMSPNRPKSTTVASSAPAGSILDSSFDGNSTSFGGRASPDSASLDRDREREKVSRIAAQNAAAARLFKEGYMEVFYPFINSNLSRVSEFLDQLGVLDSIDCEIRPGVEEGLSPSITQDDLVARAKEFERSLWSLHGAVKGQLGPLCNLAESMVQSGALTLPRATPGATFSGQHAMLELTKAKHSDLVAAGQDTTPTSTQSIASFLTRFRGCMESLVAPTWLTEEIAAAAHATEKPHGASSISSTTGVKDSAPAPQQSALSAAAASGLKFFQRFLPATSKDRAASASQAPPLVPGMNSNTPQHLAPIPIDGPAGSVHPPNQPTTPSRTHSASSSSPPGVHSSNSRHGGHSEDFTLFKQTSVEIQLRLSEQLEESEQRCAALQNAYQQLEQQSFEKDEVISQLRQQLRQLQGLYASATPSPEPRLHLKMEPEEDDS